MTMRRIAILSACLLAGVHLREGRVLDVAAEDGLLLIAGGRARDALPGEELTPEEEPEGGQGGATGASGADPGGGQAGGAEGAADTSQASLGV